MFHIKRWSLPVRCRHFSVAIEKVGSVVMRSAGHGRKFRRCRLQGCGVSKAIWPHEARWRIATGRMAQQRRVLILKGVGWASSAQERYRPLAGLISSTLREQRLRRRVHVHLWYPVAVGGAIALSVLVAAVEPRQWLTAICVATVCVAGAVVAVSVLQWLLRQAIRSRQEREVALAHKWRRYQAKQARKAAREQKEWQQPRRTNFPETPMPITPLIRVLETIDLSTSSIEHFLDAETDRQAVPEEYRREKEGSERIFQSER